MSEVITLLRSPTVVPANSLNGSSIVPSLALGYLSATLAEKNIIATVLDAQIEAIGQMNTIENWPNFLTHGLSDQEILEKIPRETTILGISVMFSTEWPYVRELIKKIKSYLPHLFIIAGGEHITAVPELTLRQCKEIDIGVIGEGEETLIEFLENYKKPEIYSKIQGLVYLKNEEFIKTPSRGRIKSVTNISWPKWSEESLTKFFDSKLSHGPYRGRTMPILASRGCPYDCQFCSNKTMWGNNYWSRDPKDVVDEIQYYISKYNIKCFEFMDLTVYMKRTWIIDFCNELINRDVKIMWQCTGGTRTEAINEEVILLTKKAGCEYLGFAPESGSKEVLKVIKKRISLPKMLNLFKIMKKHNVGSRANLIIGFPDETRVQILHTIFLQFRLAFLGVLDAPLFIFTPYPGSDFFNLLHERKFIPNFTNSTTVTLDHYFYNLGQDFGTISGKGYNKNVGIKELRFYQTFGMALFYLTQYVLFPNRLYRFIKSIFTDKKSQSVFEQRITQNFTVKSKK